MIHKRFISIDLFIVYLCLPRTEAYLVKLLALCNH